jgi:hypothetical protein
MEGQRVGGPRECGREGCLEAWLLLRDIAIARRSHAANSKTLRNYETSQQTDQPIICVTITGNVCRPIETKRNREHPNLSIISHADSCPFRKETNRQTSNSLINATACGVPLRLGLVRLSSCWPKASMKRPCMLSQSLEKRADKSGNYVLTLEPCLNP